MRVKYIELADGHFVIFSEELQHSRVQALCGQSAVSAGNVKPLMVRRGSFYSSSFSLKMDSNPNLSWDRDDLFAADFGRTFIFSTSKAILEEMNAENIRPAVIVEKDGYFFPVGEGDRVEALEFFFDLAY